MANIELTTNQQFNGLVIKDKNILLPKFLFYFASQFKEKLLKLSGTTSFSFVSIKTIRENIKIPLPPLEVQEKIVEKIEEEEKKVEECKSLIEIFEKKIEKEINRVWGND